MNKTTEKSKIRSVKFEYVGTDEQLVMFLKCIISDYITGNRATADLQEFYFEKNLI